MHNQPALFDIPAPATPPAAPQASTIPRRAKRERARVLANPETMERYERVLRTAGPVLRRFVGSEITAQYERRYAKLTVSEARGLGGLYARLLSKGVIVKTNEFKPRVNGCPQVVYEWNL